MDHQFAFLSIVKVDTKQSFTTIDFLMKTKNNHNISNSENSVRPDVTRDI